VLNPKFRNIPLNNLAISPKETLVGATWVTAFGQEQTLSIYFLTSASGTYLPLDIAIKSNWLKMLGFTPGTFQFE